MREEQPSAIRRRIANRGQGHLAQELAGCRCRLDLLPRCSFWFNLGKPAASCETCRTLPLRVWKFTPVVARPLGGASTAEKFVAIFLPPSQKKLGSLVRRDRV